MRAGARADDALAGVASGLDTRERAFLMELAFGAIRWRGRIDHHLDALLDEGLASVPPDVADVLRLGAYQILFMDRVPPWSAVDESVALARAALRRGTARWAAGLVNGVLRNLVRRKDDLALPDRDADLAGHLAVRWSHPRWMVERWLDALGREATEALLARNDAPPRLHLAPNPLLTEAGDLVAALGAAGVAARLHPDGRPGAVELLEGAAPEGLPGWDAGRFWVQDAGAQWVLTAAPPPAAGAALEVCTAPGTKLVDALAGAPGLRALAVDLDVDRLALAAGALARLGLGDRARLVVADARALPTGRCFEWVLADVPCSGTGVLRRRVDARWRRRPSDLGRFATLQGAILDAAADRVRPGGTLVYATCSLENEENDDVVHAFLDRTPAFRIEPVADVVPERFRRGPFLLTRPWLADLDGMFAARLVREAA